MSPPPPPQPPHIPMSEEKPDTGPRLSALRELMHKDNLDYYIVPSEDAHQSEYVSASDRRREYISGFSGSYGQAIVTRNSAYLVIDFRCWLQAQQRVDPNWALVKTGSIGGPKDWIEWLVAKVRGSRIGIDARMISHEKAMLLNTKLVPLDSTLIYPPQNLVDIVWKDKVPRSRELVWREPIEFTGEEASSKLNRLRDWMKAQPSVPTYSRTPQTEHQMHVATLITSLSSIAYLLNLRGSDIPFSPLFCAYLFVSLTKAVLFVNASKVNEEISGYLQSLDIERREYSDLWQFLRRREWGTGKILITPQTPFAISLMLTHFRYTVAPSFVEEMIAVKNETEVEGLRRAYHRDGASFVRLFAWLEAKLNEGYNITEYEAAQRLTEFRRKTKHFMGREYKTISASGPNAALPHYSLRRSTARMIDLETPYLNDSGGAYREGTCNTARTVHFGRPTPEQCEAFTRVLQYHIAIDSEVFPEGTSGSQLDFLARQAFWRNTLNHKHGTGHGLESFLTVHRGARDFSNSVPLILGDIITNQPGIYNEGRWGMRLESALTVHRVQTPDKFNGTIWLSLERLTCVPIQTRMVKESLLTTEEKQWLKDHNQRCFQLLSPHLKEDKRAMEWLKREADYGIDTVMGRGGISRASFVIDGPKPTNTVEEPAIWPVILWVAFQVQKADSSEPKSFDAFLTLIQSDAVKHVGLWSWDEADEEMLRRSLISHTNSSWIDGYPASWQEYIILLDLQDWARIESLTHQPSRSRVVPSEYDAAIRIGAIVLWASSNGVSDSDINILLALEIFLSGNLVLDHHGFLRCLSEPRVSIRVNGPDSADWHQPRTWLDSNREQLRSSVFHHSNTTSFMHMVENMYMVYYVGRALPLHFMSLIFACILKKYNHGRLEEFRAKINIWKTWDTMTCLMNYRSVLATAVEFSKLTEEHDLPKSFINIAIHTDIHCVCAQVVDSLSDPTGYQDILKAQDDRAQKLLDLLQDILDYSLLHARVRPVILKALLKLSTKCGKHPRCFALSGRLQLLGHQIAAGSFGDVWKGLIHDEVVSVKVLRVYQEADVEALLKEFYHEALIWRQLSHANILPFFGVYYLGDTKTQLCLVSPWMENGNMARYLKSNPVGVNRLTLVLDVAFGLEHLHSSKIVHGDLKAINVLVTRSGRAVLADFGLSSVTDSKIFWSTSTGKAGGTVRWQAPELFMIGGSRNSFASDVYAFSCVCYEIFTENLPFYDLTNDVAVIFQVMEGQRPKRSSKIPDDVWNLMEECWKANPEERPSAEQIVFRLRGRPINAIPTDAASDWAPWHSSKFRYSLEEHTLFLSCGTTTDWLQFTHPQSSHGIRSPEPIFSTDPPN